MSCLLEFRFDCIACTHRLSLATPVGEAFAAVALLVELCDQGGSTRKVLKPLYERLGSDSQL